MDSLPFSNLKSNWQFVIFYLIEHLVNENIRDFSIFDITWNVEDIYLLLAIHGHEQKPKHLRNSLLRTLQTMRDKQWINFHAHKGEYDLSDEGYKVILMIKPKIQNIRQNRVRLFNETKNILKEWEVDLEEFT
jgi:hypothetical protein